MQTFRDDNGREWYAFEVTAETLISGRTDLLPPNYARGWLTFESDRERRRLAPVPADWKHLGAADLRALLSQATVVRSPKSLRLGG